jgi:hypothetical protein
MQSTSTAPLEELNVSDDSVMDAVDTRKIERHACCASCILYKPKDRVKGWCSLFTYGTLVAASSGCVFHE